MKTPKLALVLGLTVAGMLQISSHSQTDEQAKWNQQYRSEYEVPLGNYTGRSPFMNRATRAEPAPALGRPCRGGGDGHRFGGEASGADQGIAG